jgi:hypothetical protein
MKDGHKSSLKITKFIDGTEQHGKVHLKTIFCKTKLKRVARQS